MTMKAKNIPYAEVAMPDPVNQPDQIVLKGVPAGELFRPAHHC